VARTIRRSNATNRTGSVECLGYLPGMRNSGRLGGLLLIALVSVGCTDDVEPTPAGGGGAAAEGGGGSGEGHARSLDGGQTFAPSQVVFEPVLYDLRRTTEQWLGDYLGVKSVNGAVVGVFVDNSAPQAHVAFFSLDLK
jgi:hypothetical protein